MNAKAYYEMTKNGIAINGKIMAPRISQTGEAIQWVVDEADGASVIAHLAANGLTNVRTMVKSGKMAIEAK